MTRQYAIVNLSNWDGEDVLIRRGQEQKEHRLKPGESVVYGFGLGGLPTAVVDIEPVGTVVGPFLDEDGKQVFPELSTDFK